MRKRDRGLLALLLLAACRPEEAPPPAALAEPSRSSFGTCSWRPGAEIPLWSDAVVGEIPFGQLGRTPHTRLYLTFDTDLAHELEVQGRRWSAAGSPTRAPGRYGSGLALDGKKPLAIPVPGDAALDVTPHAWTLELWVKPDELGPCSVLTLPGLLTLTCEASGLLVLRTPGGRDAEDVPRATTVKSAVPLAIGRWSHVGLVLDPRDTESLRLVVDGEARARELEGAVVAPADLAVVLGAGGPKRGLAGVVDELRLQARAANTDEFQAALEEPRPLERLRITPSGREPRELEVWFGVQRAPRIDGPEAWQLGELERAVADEHGLRRVDGAWRRIDACDPPVARTTQANVLIGDHRILLFGGETRDSHYRPMRNTDDTWLFDTVAETWERLPLDLAPAGRCHQAAAFSPEHGVVVLAGGFNIEDGTRRPFQDTWLFHVAERRWEHVEEADLPYGFSDDVVVYHPRLRRFVFVSGNQVRTFDPATRRWESVGPVRVVDEAGAARHSRPEPAMIGGYAPTTDEIVLFGGSRDPQDDTQFVDDVYVLDVEAARMTWLAPSTTGERPSPRVRSGFGWDAKRSRFVLFGGVRSQRSVRMDDLWSFDPATRRWSRHEASNTPTARGGYHGMEYDPELDRFFLLCGRHSHARFLADAWTLSLDERAPGRTRHVFDRSAFPERAWYADEETPGDSAVELRFRESADAVLWTEWTATPPDGERYLEVELTLRPGSQGEVPRVASMGFR